MRKTILVAVWLLVPVLLLAYHYGPGQTRLSRDDAAQNIADARQLETSGDWLGAYEAWTEALAALPETDIKSRTHVQLAKARARMYIGELPEAIEDLEQLLDSAQGILPEANTDEIRATLATAQYYAGWLMRLEGAPSEEWMLPVESSRMNFRMLAEGAANAKLKSDYKKNLEASIRLAQMDLSELEGLPLPKFCQGCKNVSQKCRSQRQAKSEKQGEGEKKEEKDARGAGFNDIPKGGS